MLPIILYDNKFLTATLSESASAEGYATQNILDQRTYKYWKASAGGTNYITGQWGSAPAVNCVGIAGHNFYSVGVTVKVYSSDNGSSWTQRATVIPTNNKVIILTFNTVSAAYWKVEMVNTVGAPQVAVIFIGSYLQFPYPMNAPLEPSARSIKVDTAESEDGLPLGACVKYSPIEINHVQGEFTRTWFSTYFQPFYDNYAELMNWFFYAPDLTNMPGDAYYCRFKEDYVLRTPASRLDYFDSLTLSLKAIQ